MQKITRKNLRPFLEKHATKERVLEIGGGRTKTNHSYQDLFPNRYTFDIDPKREPDQIGDVHDLPFVDNSFSNILCTEVLEHLHSPHIAISEMRRVLKPGGKLVLTTRFNYPVHDAPFDYYRYTKYGLGYLFKEWSELKILSETGTFSGLGALFQRVGFQTKLKGGKFTKLFIYGFSFILSKMDSLLVEEYGDIRQEKREESIITTGYYLTAVK